MVCVDDRVLHKFTPPNSKAGLVLSCHELTYHKHDFTTATAGAMCVLSCLYSCKHALTHQMV